MASESDDISRYEIFIDEAATSDISAIYEYLVENADIQIAEKQGDIIFTCIEKLDVFPNGHPVFDSSLSPSPFSQEPGIVAGPTPHHPKRGRQPVDIKKRI